jgi:hypothetical protein
VRFLYHQTVACNVRAIISASFAMCYGNARPMSWHATNIRCLLHSTSLVVSVEED